jgi:hypothetical protein
MATGPPPRFLSLQDTMHLIGELSKVAQDRPRDAFASTVEREVLAAMESAHIHPALIHAFRRTGILVSDENQDLWTRAELDRWTEAVAGYRPDEPAGEAVPASARLVTMFAVPADAPRTGGEPGRSG